MFWWINEKGYSKLTNRRKYTILEWINKFVERRYSKLVFSGYTADNDLLDGFISGLTDVNILQVLMDGPIVNWKCYGHVTIDREQAEFLGFINIKYGKLWSPCFPSSV